MRWWTVGVAMLVVALALVMLAIAVRPGHAQVSCQANYTVGCIGSTVCFTATGTSAIVIPQNLQRRYLLIQSQSTTLPVYFAIGTTTTTVPLTAVIGTDTIILQPVNSVAPNYEVSSLNATATPPPHVPAGAIALITGGSTIGVCISEANG